MAATVASRKDAERAASAQGSKETSKEETGQIGRFFVLGATMQNLADELMRLASPALAQSILEAAAARPDAHPEVVEAIGMERLARWARLHGYESQPPPEVLE